MVWIQVESSFSSASGENFVSGASSSERMSSSSSTKAIGSSALDELARRDVASQRDGHSSSLSRVEIVGPHLRDDYSSWRRSVVPRLIQKEAVKRSGTRSG